MTPLTIIFKFSKSSAAITAVHHIVVIASILTRGLQHLKRNTDRRPLPSSYLLSLSRRPYRVKPKLDTTRCSFGERDPRVFGGHYCRYHRHCIELSAWVSIFKIVGGHYRRPKYRRCCFDPTACVSTYRCSHYRRRRFDATAWASTRSKKATGKGEQYDSPYAVGFGQ